MTEKKLNNKFDWKLILAFIAGGGLTQIGNIIVTVSDELQEWTAKKPTPVVRERDPGDTLAVDLTKQKRRIEK